MTFVERTKALATQRGQPCHPVEMSAGERGAIDLLVEEFTAMPGNRAGGLLHAVIEDSNWHEDHIRYCREAARAANDEPAYWLAQLLLTLLPEDRLQLECVCPCCKEDALADALASA